jgi:DNA-binding NtrC family response regulator
MSRILALTPDLFFSTRIQSTLERAGHATRIVDIADGIGETLAEAQPDLAILDTGAFNWPWEQILVDLRAAAPALPVLAYGSHMDVDATKRAQSLGATRVVAKSEFVNNMLNLVARYALPELKE